MSLYFMIFYLNCYFYDFYFLLLFLTLNNRIFFVMLININKKTPKLELII
jgi:hypothetical protein